MPIHAVEGAPRVTVTSIVVPMGELQLPWHSWGDLSTLTHRSGSACYEIAAFTLGLSACEIVCPPFTSEMSISTSPLGLLRFSPAGLQS